MEANKNKSNKRCCTCANVVNRFFEKIFGGLGTIIARFPFVTIVICLLVAGGLGAGFAFMKGEDRVEKLYIPPDSDSLKYLDKARQFFPLIDTKQEKFIIVAKDGQNLLSKQCLSEILKLHNVIISVANYDKYCIKLSKKCVLTNPLELFDFDENKLVNISHRITEFYNTTSYLMRNGRPLSMNLAQIFGKPVWKEHALTSTSAVQIAYLMSPLDQDNEAILEYEKTLIDEVFAAKKNFKCAQVYTFAGRSLSDAIADSSQSDILLISMTFTIMIMFACCSLIKFKNPLTSHAWLANAGILAVGLGILSGFGLAMYVGTPFISIVGVLPFLILGVGIDDIFIIVDELDRIDVAKQNVQDTLKLVMAHSGASITMTTLTDLVAFAVSTSTKFPSIRYFCIYAALSITFAYLMIISFFVAFVTFDVKRMRAGRRDFCPTCTVPQREEGQQSWSVPSPPLSSKIMRSWGGILMHNATRVIVVLVSLGLLGVSIFYALKISEDFDRRFLAKEDSYVMDFLNAEEKYYPMSFPINIVIDSQDIKYNTKETQQAILNLSTIATANTYNKDLTVSWMDSLQSFAKKANLTLEGASFMPTLNKFLSIPEYGFYKQDIVFSADKTRVVASRIRCFMKSTRNSVVQKDAMLSLRDELKTKSNIPAYAITKVYIYLEQYAHTKSETTLNIGLAGAVVFLIMLPFLLSITATLVVTFGFGALICELFAWMYMLDVSLNMISTIQLVMAIGFAVDYSAHIAHAYLVSTKMKPEDRAIQALSTTGASVLMGGTSTFLGMVVTAFASSEIFRIFFKMFVGIVGLGLLHGLCFLPVYLSLFYRWSPDTEDEHSSTLHLKTKHSVGVSNEAYNGNLHLVTDENQVNDKVEPIFSAGNTTSHTT